MPAAEDIGERESGLAYRSRYAHCIPLSLTARNSCESRRQPLPLSNALRKKRNGCAFADIGALSLGLPIDLRKFATAPSSGSTPPMLLAKPIQQEFNSLGGTTRRPTLRRTSRVALGHKNAADRSSARTFQHPLRTGIRRMRSRSWCCDMTLALVSLGRPFSRISPAD